MCPKSEAPHGCGQDICCWWFCGWTRHSLTSWGWCRLHSHISEMRHQALQGSTLVSSLINSTKYVHGFGEREHKMPLFPSTAANEVHTDELEHFCHQGPDPAVTTIMRELLESCHGGDFHSWASSHPCTTQVPLIDAFCLTIFFQTLKCYLLKHLAPSMSYWY